MKRKNTAIVLLLLAISFAVCRAQNPVVQTCYTADPAPMVYGDTVFLYTGHDADSSTNFTMKDWRLFSSTDMVNWTDRGTPLSPRVFVWAKQDNDAWASQCIERNGKFYWYVTAGVTAIGRHGIGVAVADSPTGTFVDALGKPLIDANWGDIDPTVFIDDDGQAYLYWGNNGLWYVKLNEDMISYSGSIVKVDDKDKAAFGPDFEEAPWLYKRNNLYYLIYAANGVPEDISYSTSNSPTGPWVYRDTIMPRQGGSFTNHPGIIDFKGKSYFFYHNGALPRGGGFTRSVCVEPFEFNADGTIPKFNMTATGIVNPVHNLNPYQRTEAETIAWEKGIETEENAERGVYVTDIHNGDYIKVRAVDFGTVGAGTFTASVASASGGGNIELRLDALDGTVIGSLPVSNTGGWNRWQTKTTNVTDATGIHDLYLIFKGKGTDKLFNADYWIFNENPIIKTKSEADYRKWALTPPMGWNSWDCFNAGATETQILQNAEYMRDNLKEYGWEYIVLDIRWYVAESANYYIQPATYSLDEWGRYVPPTTRFPNGFKSMADKIHAMGLKFGIHIMRGLPKEAARRKLPVKGANGVTCDQISNNEMECPWLQDNYKVINNENGQLYYNSIFDLYAEWGVDFVKVDDISRPFHEDEIQMVRKAIDRCGRPIVLSLSPGKTDLQYADVVGNYANMWRMTDDLWDRWGDIYAIFERARKWAPYYRPGCYPDADMIPIGALDYASNFTDHRWSKLTDNEQKTLMNLWGIIHSPLMFGGNLPANTEKELRLMTNRDLIAMNQHGVNAREIYNESDKVVWASTNPATGEHYACLFNLKGSGKKYSTEGATHTTQVIAYTLPYEDVEIQIPAGVNQITLLLDDAGDSYDFDHGDWADARFVLDNGDEIFVTEDDIVSHDAEGSYFRYIKINKNLFDGALNVAGTQYSHGIACHSNTLIDLRLPAIDGRRVVAFKSRCGVDASAGGNNATSMRFMVFLFDPTDRELMPNTTVTVALPLTELGFSPNQECRITDGWSKEVLGVYKNDEFRPELEAHQSGFYIITPKQEK